MRFIDGARDHVDPQDRGLSYGDGLFETMLAVDGRIRWLDFHLDRLGEGCDRLEISRPHEPELRAQLSRRVPPRGRATVKLILTRGSGHRGYAPPPDPSPLAIVTVSEAAAPSGSTAPAAHVLDLRLAESEKLAGIKHLCRLEQVLAQLELHRRGIEEGILVNRSGLIVGCTSANLFVVHDGRLATPVIDTAGVRGVMRRVVLAECRHEGIAADEAYLPVASLQDIDEAFLTNALIGIRSLSSIDGRSLPSRALADRLRETIFAGVDA